MQAEAKKAIVYAEFVVQKQRRFEKEEEEKTVDWNCDDTIIP